MKEIRPGCYKPNGQGKRCGDESCNLRDRCLKAEGEAPPPKLIDETALQKRGAEGKGSDLGT